MFREGIPRSRLDDPPTVMVLGLVAVAVVLAPLGHRAVAAAVGGLAGVALVLLAGQALRLALVPSRGRGGGPADRLERWSWTIALSLASPVLGVFVLNAGPTGIDRVGWAVLLGTVMLVAGAAAWARHGRPGPLPRLRPPGVVGYLSTAAVLGIAATALWLGVGSATAVPYPAFTQLYLVPQDTAAAAGVAVADQPPTGPVLGVHSFEDRPHEFRLELQTDTGTVVQAWTFRLGPGERWRQDVRWPEATRAVLYRGMDPTPYRQVWLDGP